MADANLFRNNVGRVLIALLFLGSGTLHLLTPAPFVGIVPPYLPWPGALVAVSGAAEILGAVGILTPNWRRIAAYGLILLLLAVLPANVYMATERLYFPTHPLLLWARLPLQFVLIAWVWMNRI